MVPGKGSRSIFSACEIERRAGGARSHRHCISCDKHLSALMRPLWELACRRWAAQQPHWVCYITLK